MEPVPNLTLEHVRWTGLDGHYATFDLVPSSGLSKRAMVQSDLSDHREADVPHTPDLGFRSGMARKRRRFFRNLTALRQ